LAFQVPVVVILLVRLNMVSIQKLKDFRGYFIVLAFVIAAVVTPPDVISQLALAVPMCLLYEMGIWGARWFVKPPVAEEATAPPQT
jgi:sec-independent protein translocase protein TatC